MTSGHDRPEPRATAASSWRVRLVAASNPDCGTAADESTNEFVLPRGRRWRLGSAANNDCVLLGTGIAADHLCLALDGEELQITAVEPVLLGFRSSGTTMALPRQAHVTWPAEDVATLTLGAWQVCLLQGPRTTGTKSTAVMGDRATKSAAQQAPAGKEPSPRQGTSALALGLCAGVALLAAATWAAVPPPAPSTRNGSAPAVTVAAPGNLLAQRLLNADLGPAARVHAPTASQPFVKVTGILLDEPQCKALRDVRQALGPDTFVSQAVCLPELLGVARNFLEGTGVGVDIQGQGLRLHGAAHDAAAAARVALARSQLAPLVPVDDSAVDAAAQATGAAALSAELLPRVRSFSSDDGGWVVLRTGETVYPGGALAPGVGLVAIENETMVVSKGGSTLRLALVKDPSR